MNEVVWKINTSLKTVYLTFDDGPIPEMTERILQVLDFFDAKATFFCVGENVKKYPNIYEKILKKGHITGNHTYSHLSGMRTSTPEYLNDIDKATQYIKSDLFRPPHGRMKFSQQCAVQKKYKVVLWDVLSYDFSYNISKKECYSNVKHFTRPGSIVVFHDNVKAEKNMFYSLSNTLVYFSEKGYKFKALTPDIFNKILSKKQTVNRKRLRLANFI